MQPRRPNRTALAALTVACIGVFFTALDQTVVVTALPQIIVDLNIPITRLDNASWIVSAYLLGFVLAMPLMGRVSDIYGRRRVFLLCLLIFGLGSLFCGVAPILGKYAPLGFLSLFHLDPASSGLAWLILARLVQAIGGGAVVPVAMAIAGDFYGPERRGIALGIIGAVTEIGGVLGPVYGAFLVEHWGWQSIFYLNIPLVLVIMIAGWKLIPQGSRLHEGIDWLGSLLLGIALTCLSLGLAQQGTSLGPATVQQTQPQNNPIMLLLSVVFLVAFLLVERKTRWPVVDLSLFKNLSFSASSLVSLLVGAALIIAMADIPIYMDTVLQHSVMDSGLALLRMTAFIPLGALLGGWLCNAITCRWTAVLGLLYTATGFYLMSRWPINVGWTQITISTVTAGLGFGLVISPISTTAINAVRARQAGMSSAIVTALRMVGMMLGLAALTSWALASFQAQLQHYQALPKNATAGQYIIWAQGYAVHAIKTAHSVYNNVFFATMFLCLLAIIPAFFLWGNKPPVEGTVQLTKPTRQRKPIIAATSIALSAILIGGAFLGFLLSRDMMTPGKPDASLVGKQKFQVGLNKEALTSLFTSQLGLQQETIKNFSVAPAANNGLLLNMTLHLDTNGLKRDLPVSLEGALTLDHQQNLHLHITHMTRDGQAADAATIARMQKAVDTMFSEAVIPALRTQLSGVKLVAVQTGTGMQCSPKTQMLVLVLEVPVPADISIPSMPDTFCLTRPIDLNALPPIQP
uniref:Major facilitator superfamily (MFS) profile domain-containing protein n=1 Tax=Thermosporothrix sp. COM3 TaxID=2490863 RepID=A0A455SPD8_9CHLR|nr:hypothetical protein KTC_50540 [Thermosporothrix sp. COM3]